MVFFRALLAPSVLAVLPACHRVEPVRAADPPVATSSASASTPPSPDERALRIGTKVPPFQLERLDGGGRVDLPNGRVTVIAFLATWNAPAKHMLVPLQQLHADYAAKGLDVIAVFVDDEATGVREFAESHGVRFAVTWDKGHVVADKLRPSSMPTAYVVDRSGILRFATFGYHEGAGELLARDAASLL
jgi:peroxiredoxin